MANTASDRASASLERLAVRHPCFSEQSHHKYGRIHLPVSPACNLQCRFCKRGFNKSEIRPGVSRGILAPEGVVALVRRALTICPEITVVGIAGPGDTLATDHALEAFRHIEEAFPWLLKCLSTNGLRLAERSEEIAAVGVNAVTVTVNAATPEVLTKVISEVRWRGKRLDGLEAARALLAAQLAGIEAVARRDVVVKINTVLIPGINEHEVGEIARVTAERGASIINVIPLIPQHELADHPAPDCDALQKARDAAGKSLAVFRHCRQCRADACGIPGSGKDFGGLLYDHTPMTFSHG